MSAPRLATDFRLWVHTASPGDLRVVLALIADEMDARVLPGSAHVAQAGQILDRHLDQVHALRNAAR